MVEQNERKLNRLYRLLPENWVGSARWLGEHGYSTSLVAHYRAKRWLDSPARGAYVRPGSSPRWQHVVISLQRLEGMPMHVGGRTALVQRGLAHYLRLGAAEPVHLYGPGGLPAWARALPLAEKLIAHLDAMFGALPRAFRDESGRLVDSHGKTLAAATLADSGLSDYSWGDSGWTITCSTEERAILEVLQGVPGEESIYEADALLSSLANLRPARLMHLLSQCFSIKVKRLFLALAERQQHAWFKRLDLGRIDIGAGKRMLAPGGRLHPKYLITLPADLDDHAG